MITLEDLQNATYKIEGHLDGQRGRNGWSATLFRCVEFPRLTRQNRTYRQDGRRVAVHLVDGEVIGEGLAVAEVVLERLNGPEKPDKLRQVLDEFRATLGGGR